MTDGDIAGIVGGGVGLAVGALTIGYAGRIMMDAADQMSNKKKRKKGKNNMNFSMPKINI